MSDRQIREVLHKHAKRTREICAAILTPYAAELSLNGSVPILGGINFASVIKLAN